MLLDEAIQTPDATALEMQRYLAARVSDLRVPSTAEEFTREANRLRRHLLDEVVLHGWPKEWVETPLKVEDLGQLPSGKGVSHAQAPLRSLSWIPDDRDSL